MSVNHFEIGENSLKVELFKDNNGLTKPLLSIHFDDFPNKDFISIDSMVDIDEMVLEGNNSIGNCVAIASSNDPGRGGLLLGIDKDNCDKIYKWRWEALRDHESADPYEISENIYDFVLKLKSTFMWNGRIDSSKLYKNWNEEFWRMKDS